MANILLFPTRKNHVRDSADSTGYKSGLSSCLETPLTRSTAKTRKGGTSSHCDTACAVIPRANPKGPTPPADFTARRKASVLSFMGQHESPAFTKSQAQLACVTKAALYHPQMTLGDRIREARKRRGISQAELGRHFCISSQAVSQWETHPDKGPQRDRMPELAKILDVPIDWLTGSDPEAATTNELFGLVERLPPEARKMALRMLRAMVAKEDSAA